MLRRALCNFIDNPMLFPLHVMLSLGLFAVCSHALYLAVIAPMK